jgi:hypothetical protein
MFSICSPSAEEKMMEGDGNTLGLLLELRALCDSIVERNEYAGKELHDLLQRLRNPNLHELDDQLRFRVIQKTAEYHGETLRTVAACANLGLGHAALREAARQDPNSHWLLLYPGGVAGRHEPPGMVINDK